MRISNPALVVPAWTLLLVAVVGGCNKGDSDGAAPFSAAARPPKLGDVGQKISLSPTTYAFGTWLSDATTVVAIPGYSISKTPVTVGQYRACVEAGGCSAPESKIAACKSPNGKLVAHGPTFSESPEAASVPVTCMTAKQGADYCHWAGGALPTAEEWMYAARGPNPARFAWGNNEPTCDLHPAAAGCPRGDATQFAVGAHQGADSPLGMSDVLVSPRELLRVSPSSPTPACQGTSGFCAATSLSPGSIAGFVTAGVESTAEFVTTNEVTGLRCAWESSQ